MESFMPILLIIIVIIGFAHIMIKRADKITSPEKYKKESVQEPEIKVDEEGRVVCPYCGSAQIQIVKRGYHWFWGLFGSDKNERVCIRCMKKF